MVSFGTAQNVSGIFAVGSPTKNNMWRPCTELLQRNFWRCYIKGDNFRRSSLTPQQRVAVWAYICHISYGSVASCVGYLRVVLCSEQGVPWCVRATFGRRLS